MRRSKGRRDAHTFIGDDSRGCGIARGDIIHARADPDGSDFLRLVYPGNWIGGVPTGATSATINTTTPHATVVGNAGATTRDVMVGGSGVGTLTIQSGGTMNTQGVIVGLVPGGRAR